VVGVRLKRNFNGHPTLQGGRVEMRCIACDRVATRAIENILKQRRWVNDGAGDVMVGLIGKCNHKRIERGGKGKE
jgi:hypothetical protein